MLWTKVILLIESMVGEGIASVNREQSAVISGITANLTGFIAPLATAESDGIQG